MTPYHGLWHWRSWQLGNVGWRIDDGTRHCRMTMIDGIQLCIYTMGRIGTDSIVLEDSCLACRSARASSLGRGISNRDPYLDRVAQCFCSLEGTLRCAGWINQSINQSIVAKLASLLPFKFHFQMMGLACKSKQRRSTPLLTPPPPPQRAVFGSHYFFQCITHFYHKI